MVLDRLHHPPLSGQSNNAARMQSLRDEAKSLRQQMNPTTAHGANGGGNLSGGHQSNAAEPFAARKLRGIS
jgi:hypothetical protein